MKKAIKTDRGSGHSRQFEQIDKEWRMKKFAFPKNSITVCLDYGTC
jgi:hypothetical protein